MMQITINRTDVPIGGVGAELTAADLFQ